MSVGDFVHPITSLQVLDCAAKQCTHNTATGYNSYVEIYDNGTNNQEGTVIFNGKIGGIIQNSGKYINRVALRLWRPSGSTVNHRISIYADAYGASPSELWYQVITGTDFAGVDQWENLYFDVGLDVRKESNLMLVFKSNDTSGNIVRWAISVLPQYGGWDNGRWNSGHIIDATTGSQYGTTATDGERLYAYHASLRNKAAKFCYEVEDELDWINRFEGKEYTVDYTTGIITFGGIWNFVPDFNNYTREITAATTYQICRASYNKIGYTSLTLFEAIVNDFGRELFETFSSSGAVLGGWAEWAYLLIRGETLLDKMKDVIEHEKLCWYVERNASKNRLVIEDELDPTSDWSSYSTAQQDRRTFKGGADTSNDDYVKIISLRRWKKGSSIVNKLYVYGSDGELTMVRNNVNSQVTDSKGTRAMALRNQNLHTEALMQNIADEILDEYEAPKKGVQIKIKHPEVTSELEFLKSANEIFTVHDTRLNENDVFKAINIDWDFGDDLILNVRGDPGNARHKLRRNPNLKKPQIDPKIIRGGADIANPYMIESDVFRRALTDSEMNAMIKASGGFGALPSTNQNELKPGEMPTGTMPIVEEFTSLIEGEDYSYTWALGTGNCYVAIGTSNANPTSLSMQNELGRKLATYMIYTEPDTTQRHVVHVVFRFDDISSAATFPFLIKEIGISGAASGAMVSRLAFWVPTTAQDLATHKPSGAVYHPYKWFFKNTMLVVEYVVDG